MPYKDLARRREYQKTYQRERRLRARSIQGPALGSHIEAIKGALGVLEEILVDRGAKDSSRVSAARAVLEISFKTGEIEELVARVEVLEKALSNRARGES